MSGRDDYNKNESSGQGGSNQIEKRFTGPAHNQKSNHGKPDDGKRSAPQQKTSDQSSNRDTGVAREE